MTQLRTKIRSSRTRHPEPGSQDERRRLFAASHKASTTRGAPRSNPADENRSSCIGLHDPGHLRGIEVLTIRGEAHDLIFLAEQIEANELAHGGVVVAQ